MTPKLTLIAMYRALDCLNDETPDDALTEYLSDTNPYIFKDRESADPAIGEEFKEFWRNNNSDDNLSDEEAFAFVKLYLLSCTSFEPIFEDVSLPEWCDLCKIVRKEES